MSYRGTPFHWQYCSTNLSGTPKATTPGTAFTAGNTNTYGANVTLLSALSQDVQYLVIGFMGVASSGFDSNALADLLVDPTGGTSWSTKISSMACGYTPANSGSIVHGLWYHFPLYIKSGSSIGLRSQTAHTTDISTGTCIIQAFGSPSKPDMWWCGQATETLGANTSSSKGVDVTSGSNSSNGSWTSIGTSTQRYGSVQLGVGGCSTNNATNNLGYNFFIGYGSTKLTGSAPQFCTSSSIEQLARTGHAQPIFCDVASGTAWQAMGACTSASPQAINCIIHGVY
jgi:hypothetical protein